jgi:hypothetical protein
LNVENKMWSFNSGNKISMIASSVKEF